MASLPTYWRERNHILTQVMVIINTTEGLCIKNDAMSNVLCWVSEWVWMDGWMVWQQARIISGKVVGPREGPGRTVKCVGKV